MRQGLSKRVCGQLAGCLALVVAFSGGTASAASGPLAAGSAGGPAAIGEAQVSGSFVGKVEGALIGVAVIAEKPAAEGEARTISVYVCNGTSLAEWLTGQTLGNTAVLRSADRRFNARVTVTAQTASGVLALPTGRQFGFSVARAVGVAGLFDVTVAANGILRGTSSTGATLTGRLGAAGKLPAKGTVVATASAGGRDVKLTAPARHITPGAYRWIVLPTRKVYGANKRGPGLGGIGGLTISRLNGNRVVRIKAGSAGQKGYGDKKCQGLADQVNALDAIKLKAGLAGDTATLDRANAAAAAKFQELEDHCVVIEGPA